MIAEGMAIQCSLLSARPTIFPARCVLGRTPGANTVGARTNAKKIKPPIQATSESSMRKRRTDITSRIIVSRSDRKELTAEDAKEPAENAEESSIDNGCW